MKVEIKDVIRETFTPGNFMRLRHIPTGISVSGEDKFRFRLFERLLEELEEKVENYENRI